MINYVTKGMIRKEYSLTAFNMFLKLDSEVAFFSSCPLANAANCRSGRKPGARVINSARLFTPG